MFDILSWKPSCKRGEKALCRWGVQQDHVDVPLIYYKSKLLLFFGRGLCIDQKLKRGCYIN